MTQKELEELTQKVQELKLLDRALFNIEQGERVFLQISDLTITERNTKDIINPIINLLKARTETIQKEISNIQIVRY